MTLDSAISNRNHREAIGPYSVKFDELRPLDGAAYEVIGATEDSRITSADVLFQYGEDFKRSYKTESRIPGVILVHHITEEAPSNMTLSSWRLLFDMLGGPCMPHLMIVTTKWGVVPREVAEVRERQLIEHWRPMLQLGARLRRFYGDENFANRDEALSLVEEFLPMQTILPQLTEELCVQNRKLGDTIAGTRTKESMHLDLLEKEKTRIVMAQAAEGANLNGQTDVYNELVQNIAQIEAWLTKLTRAIDCLEGRESFVDLCWVLLGQYSSELVVLHSRKDWISPEVFETAYRFKISQFL